MNVIRIPCFDLPLIDLRREIRKPEHQIITVASNSKNDFTRLVTPVGMADHIGHRLLNRKHRLISERAVTSKPSQQLA